MAAATPPEHDHLFKLLLIGDSGVGKSNMLLRFADDVYREDSSATIGVDFKICSLRIQGKSVKMQIWDTAGQERFRTITSSYYRNSHGIMVVYDVTDRSSFEHVRGWMQEIEKYSKASIQRMLVGNKCDLVSKRAILQDEGADLAQELGVRFMETSAKNSHNIEHAFELMCTEILDRVSPQPPVTSNVLTLDRTSFVGPTPLRLPCCRG